MNDYIAISNLNDFIFCPYSIYLHSVYMEADEEVYKAIPQCSGTIAHKGIDSKDGSTRKGDLMAMPVYSDSLGVAGRIDIYKADQRLLIERKNHLAKVFRGQVYQLWAQYFCLTEMGYPVERLALYEISTRKMVPITLPDLQERQELETFIRRFRTYRPADDPIAVNPNKCAHCIYCNLCDKTDTDNVYT